MTTTLTKPLTLSDVVSPEVIAFYDDLRKAPDTDLILTFHYYEGCSGDMRYRYSFIPGKYIGDAVVSSSLTAKAIAALLSRQFRTKITSSCIIDLIKGRSYHQKGFRLTVMKAENTLNRSN